MVLRLWAGMVVAGSLMCAPAFGWLAEGHRLVTEGAVELLKDTLPPCFAQGVRQVADCSVDSDVHCDRAFGTLREAERPEHFFDIEFLDGHVVPSGRFAYDALLAELKLKKRDVGSLPLTILEWTERLTAAFAQLRRSPDDVFLQHKAMVYAGMLAHYTADAAMPLHTTIHYDGRVAKAGDPSPRTGIHLRVDGIFGHREIKALLPDVVRSLEVPAPSEKPWEAILAAIDESNGHVDRVYELDTHFPKFDDPDPLISDELKAFSRDRYARGVYLTALMWRTAWERSGQIRLPIWSIRLEERTEADAAKP